MLIILFVDQQSKARCGVALNCRLVSRDVTRACGLPLISTAEHLVPPGTRGRGERGMGGGEFFKRNGYSTNKSKYYNVKSLKEIFAFLVVCVTTTTTAHLTSVIVIYCDDRRA